MARPIATEHTLIDRFKKRALARDDNDYLVHGRDDALDRVNNRLKRTWWGSLYVFIIFFCFFLFAASITMLAYRDHGWFAALVGFVFSLLLYLFLVWVHIVFWD